MKKLGKTLLTGIVLSSGLLFSTSDAFAYSSKGSIDFHTDYNSYGKGASSINVVGDVPYSNSLVELVRKGGTVVQRHDIGAGHFDISLPLGGVTPGLYDVRVTSDTGGVHKQGVLTNYLRVKL
ncbi:hypothetical protein HAU06_07175 [Bacillus toyonensis]|uniref:hypothetical protein n=1 Tax=Bacillus TaxID=1386 RepID=UPI000BF53FBC|nr:MULTISPECIES: hypothetical protein [Bacillus]KAF6552321.1 hypothetical protein G9F74_23560 [Bacillus sp. EKM202B]MBC2683933.1 hypothetical protein [Bacillus toyonensis]PFZ72463.1 hypothetical protein COL72_11640 [Bacillus toyonensis]HDR7430621.1 hypothetical protein [Bacillus toyonensis]